MKTVTMEDQDYLPSISEVLDLLIEFSKDIVGDIKTVSYLEYVQYLRDFFCASCYEYLLFLWRKNHLLSCSMFLIMSNI